MYLKRGFGLGYRDDLQGVLGLNRAPGGGFCRNRAEQPVPHPTTLSKLIRRLARRSSRNLDRALLKRAVADTRLHRRRLRGDTTCIEADVRHPTGSGPERPRRQPPRGAAKEVKAAGLAVRRAFRDRQLLGREGGSPGFGARSLGPTTPARPWAPPCGCSGGRTIQALALGWFADQAPARPRASGSSARSSRPRIRRCARA